MTMLPPGLITPADRTPSVVQVERSSGDLAPASPRWTSWSIAFVLLVILTIVAAGFAVADLLTV